MLYRVFHMADFELTHATFHYSYSSANLVLNFLAVAAALMPYSLLKVKFSKAAITRPVYEE